MAVPSHAHNELERSEFSDSEANQVAMSVLVLALKTMET